MSEKVMEYLTMARIMDIELEKWVGKSKEYRYMTGMEQLTARTAFIDGFMAGFSGKYFGGNDD